MSATWGGRGDAASRKAGRQAERGAGAWTAATAAQRTARPDHAGFYGLAAELVTTLRQLDGLCDILTQQIAGYGRTVSERGYALRDDEPGHDPGERIAVASSWAAKTRTHLAAAERAANQMWSEVGHIAVEDVAR
jgi:hypothetical protein